MLCFPALCFQYPEFLYRSLGFAFYGRRGLLLLKQQIFRRSKGMARFPCRAAAFCWCANEDNSGHWVCCDRARSAFGQACASMEKPCFIIPWLFSYFSQRNIKYFHLSHLIFLIQFFIRCYNHHFASKKVRFSENT